MKRVRDFRKEYENYHGKPEKIAERSQRNKARRIVAKDRGADAVKGKDVDHKTPIRSGGGNSKSNLRVMTPKANRGWRGK